MYKAIALASVVLCGSANAVFVEGEDYVNNTQNNYWTNLDLDLDILRLDWVDTLGGPQNEQKSLADYETFIADSNDEWRFATWDEFTDLYTWFDTDPTFNGWSQEQNLGANLFFDLNGYGPAFETQAQFNDVGYTYWQFGTLNPDANGNPLSYIWFADFGDQVEGVDCPDWSVLCRSGYITNYSGVSTELHDDNPMWTAVGAIGMQGINVAPLLVRGAATQTTTPPTVVSEPQTLSIFALAALPMLLMRRRRRV